MTSKEKADTLQKALIVLGEVPFAAKYSRDLSQVIDLVMKVGRELLEENTGELPKAENSNG